MLPLFETFLVNIETIRREIYQNPSDTFANFTDDAVFVSFAIADRTRTAIQTLLTGPYNIRIFRLGNCPPEQPVPQLPRIAFNQPVKQTLPKESTGSKIVSSRGQLARRTILTFMPFDKIDDLR